ncbi:MULTISPECIES: ABC transporter permease [Vibrio]|uniref:ABC transporter permease n=1 Tax=Vibrio TaxID=662 RepID=UPI00063631A1|nr:MULTISPECIES: ABC transporter permease [Vibrio]NAZ96169.1 ABC transporter permease [Vibrio toranzoniae]CDT03695.1 putative Ribose/xylose/arabinose/galactoside ABC-type transport systems, permease component [Vibrio coralliirubri]CDT58950.1 putative Ribose/xylose/arabinose/galactoside ABC-type transport systems, permease component [Vibrio coralliirubri]CDT68784.1 putative Ribose/xylose/arabinose/galactoside ABC-type transport systems, permease component [Vibrio coralliirubri]CDT84630.1 putati
MEQVLNSLKLPTDKNIRYLLVILVGILVVMGFTSGQAFFSIGNLQSMSSQMPLLGLLALAMAVCMLTGGINLSIIATTNACGLVMASIITQAPDSFAMLVLALAGGLITAVVIGLLNGALIAYVGVSPILATLGMMTLINGLNVLISGGSVISGFPEALLVLGNGSLMGIPMPLILFVGFAIGLWALLEHTSLGRTIYLMGSNEKATRFSGINTQKATLYVYALSSILCWAAAIVMMAKFNSAKAGYGESYLLIAILASVLGGINPDGGFGRIIGIGLALIVLQTLESGLNLLGVSSYLTMALWGGILILFIFLQKNKA